MIQSDEVHGLRDLCENGFRNRQLTEWCRFYIQLSEYRIDVRGDEFTPSVANVRNALDHMMRAIECVFSDDDSKFGDSEEKRVDYIETMVSDACKHLKRACLDTLDDMAFHSIGSYNGLRGELYRNGNDIRTMDALCETVIESQNNLRLRKDSTEHSFDRDLEVAKEVFGSLRELDAVLPHHIGPFAGPELYSAETVIHRSDIPDTVVCQEVLDAYGSYKESVMSFESRMCQTPYYAVQRAVVGFLGMVGDGCSRGADAFNHLVSAALESDLLFVDICNISIWENLRGFTQEDATSIDRYLERKGLLIDLKERLKASCKGDVQVLSNLIRYSTERDECFMFMRDVELAAKALPDLHEERKSVHDADRKLSWYGMAISIATFIIGLVLGHFI